MEESHNETTPPAGASPMSYENNNYSQLKWKEAESSEARINSVVMPCNVPLLPISVADDSHCNESSSFQIINIDPCYVTSISSYQYETFKLSTAYVTQGPCEQGRLAQMKANTKLKRTRKPYQFPNRCPPLRIPFHGNHATSLGNREHNSTSLQLRSTGPLNRSRSNRVVSLIDERPTSGKSPSNLCRSRSLEDLRSLAKTTTVMFNPPNSTQDGELDEVSNVLSNLHVSETARDQL